MPDTLRERLQVALGSTYSLERELSGGMSRVFVAMEAALARRVVVKVLPPERTYGVNVDRFRREIQVAAQLQHPHIVPVLSAGDADGLLYYTMPFVVGESLRTRLAGRRWLDWIAMAALGVPGVVLGIGYLRTFRDFQLPFADEPFTASWIIIAIAYTVRRLPYALRSCMAALQQLHLSLEEAAESLGATKARTVKRVVVPLMAGGILAGFVTSFITAAVELSATIVLSASATQAPMSFGIYLYMQSIAGRGPGAALGVIAVVLVGLGTYASYRLTQRRDTWNL